MASKFLKHIKAIWYRTPVAQAKGALKGQVIRVTNPKRYEYLKSLRPNRKLLIEHKKELVSKVKIALADAGIKPVKVFGRVKTLGSLDRKDKYIRKKYPGHFEDFIRTDILGVTIVMDSMDGCRNALEAIKKVSSFPKESVMENPTDYSKTKVKDGFGRPEGLIQGYFKLPNIPIAQINILTQDAYGENFTRRGKYKKYVRAYVKNKTG